MDPKLGRFEPFLGQTGFGRRRRFRPPPLHTHRPARRRRARRPFRLNFPVDRHRTHPDRAGISGGSRHGGSPDFPIFRPFQAAHISLPPFFDPLNSFLWSFFADSSPFERYGENKFGRRLDRVFWPPQQLLDKVRVLLCSRSLGLSVDIKFVNFGRRLVSFQFLGNFG